MSEDTQAQWPKIAKQVFMSNGVGLTDRQIDLFVSKLALGRRCPDPSQDCWEWGGQFNQDRYGVWDVYDVGGKRRVNYRTHRLGYLLAKGDIKAGNVIHHSCGNRACCNPSHLESIEHRDHAYKEFSSAYRATTSTHCKNGHEYTEENTTMWRGHRHCKACQRATNKLRYERFKKKNGIITIPQEERTHCANGHEFVPENIYWYRGASGNLARGCKECRKKFKKDHEIRRHEEILAMRRERYKRTYKISKGLIDGAGI